MEPTRSEPQPKPASEQQDDLTSFHIRRAGAGDGASVEWIVTRFTPFLRTQAEYRLRGALRRFCEPSDVVDDVWATVLPRLCDLRSRDERWTPVLLRFLSTTLLHKVNHVLTQYARSTLAQGGPTASTISGRKVERVPDEVTSVPTRAMRSEAGKLLREAIEHLEPPEREILVLRGIEQLPHAEIAGFLGENVGAVTMRYHRTLEKLRASLKGSVLDELPGV